MPAAPPRPRRGAASVARDLSRLRRQGRAEGLTLHEVAQALSGRSTPLLLLFLGLIGLLPTPGIPVGTVAGTLVICIAAGMLLRPGRPAVPRVLGTRRLPPGLLHRLLAFAIPFVRRLERYCRPRLSWLVSGAGLALAALGIVIQGIGLALPLPLGNYPFALGIVLIALGLLTGDGLGALLGHAVGLSGVAVFAVLGYGAVQAGTSLTGLLPW